MDRDFSPEFIFSASRSSGPGGQNVNKVSSKVELRFSVPASKILTDVEKERVLYRLAKKLTDEGILIITSQSERTQLDNKGKVIEKFYALLEKALAPRKKRKLTRPTEESKAKRLEFKRRQAEKKSMRKRPGNKEHG
jgi:ribosome-associated protein